MIAPESIDLAALPSVALPDPERGDTTGQWILPTPIRMELFVSCDRLHKTTSAPFTHLQSYWGSERINQLIQHHNLATMAG